jgi:hypothetical protein
MSGLVSGDDYAGNCAKSYCVSPDIWAARFRLVHLTIANDAVAAIDVGRKSAAPSAIFIPPRAEWRMALRLSALQPIVWRP